MVLSLLLPLLQQFQVSTSNSTNTIIDLAKSIVQLLGIITIGIGVINFINITVKPWWQTKRDRATLKSRPGAELYDQNTINSCTQYYIKPLCQSIDPSNEDEPRYSLTAKQDLFETIENALNKPTVSKYILLLADSGMGKTSFLLNYYAKHAKAKNYNFIILPLGTPDVDEQIKKIENKTNTVLLLDALDEDVLAIVDYVERLRIITNLTREFHRILITCRTQFFAKEEDIPIETGIFKVGPTPAGQQQTHTFHKIYLSPFDEKQIRTFVNLRYPKWQVWKWKKRKLATDMIQQIPNLTARPMLLTHIDDLVTTGKKITYTYELYIEMIKAWIRRETGIRFLGDPNTNETHLIEFSKRLAINLYVNRTDRKTERIPKSELVELAKKWKIAINDYKLTGRSLLNRDVVGNFKFSHRSILEYLLVETYLCETSDSLKYNLWTDQMKHFLWEIFRTTTNNQSLPEDNSIQMLGSVVSATSIFEKTLLSENEEIRDYIKSHAKSLSKQQKNTILPLAKTSLTNELIKINLLYTPQMLISAQSTINYKIVETLKPEILDTPTIIISEMSIVGAAISNETSRKIDPITRLAKASKQWIHTGLKNPNVQNNIQHNCDKMSLITFLNHDTSHYTLKSLLPTEDEITEDYIFVPITASIKWINSNNYQLYSYTALLLKIDQSEITPEKNIAAKYIEFYTNYLTITHDVLLLMTNGNQKIIMTKQPSNTNLPAIIGVL